MEKQEYINLLNQVIGLIKMRRDEQMDTIFNYGDYGLKPMFLEKYTPLKQILDNDVIEKVQIGIYKNGDLVLEKVNKTSFKDLYNQVALKVLEIEEKYQAYLVELNNNPMEERLREIIENKVY